MSTLSRPLGTFIRNQVDQGIVNSEREAEQAILEAIDENETKRRIELGREEVRQGKAKRLNAEFVTDLKSRLKRRIEAN